jgi:ParB/RepB/Spo0J family partition protein
MTPEYEDKDIPIGDLIPNEHNPNEMPDRAFNNLVKSIQKDGFSDRLIVRPLGGGKYRIIAGHHRWEAARQLGFSVVPSRIRLGDIDDDLEKAQMVRNNIIKGKLSPKKFVKMIESLNKKYTDDVLAEMMGFSETEALLKLIAQVKKQLNPAQKKAFEDAEKEIKSIKDLSKLLNQLFTQYGSTLKHHYMVFDYQGKESVWVRCQLSDLKHLYALGELCHTHHLTLDAVLAFVLKNAALDKALQAQISQLPPHLDLLPTGKLPLEDPLNK